MPLWGRVFWRSYLIALRRAGKDKRARRFALGASFLMVYVVAYAIFVSYTSLDGLTGLFYAFIFGSGTVAALLMRRWHRKEDEHLEFSLTGQHRLRPQDAVDAPPDVRTYLEERAVIVALLLARGASEIYLRLKEPDQGTEILTRQKLNAFLRQNDLWSKLEPVEADLMIAADARWTIRQQDGVFTWCEQLRLLRWIFGVDAEIVPLAHFPKLDCSLSRALLQPEMPIRNRKPLRKPWDVRVQRDVALEYLARVVSELKARGHLAEDSELYGWADEFRAKVFGPSSDYLAGAKTIAELDDEALRLIGSFAAARERYATYLVDQLNAVHPTPFAVWALEAAAH